MLVSMRTSSVLLLAVLAIVFELSSALPAVSDSRVAASEVGRSFTEVEQLHKADTKFLRSLESDDDNEERASFSWLTKIKQLVPGTTAFKAVTAARKAEQQKLIQMFTITGTTDHQLYPKFAQWFAEEKSVGEAVNAMVKFGRTGSKDAQKIGGRYELWRQTAKNKSLLK